MPATGTRRQEALHRLGLWLAAAEKAVQIHFELNVRAAGKQDPEWLNRLQTQLLGACVALEAVAAHAPRASTSDSISWPGVTLAVVWHFIVETRAETVPAAAHPALQAFAAAAERLQEFRARAPPPWSAPARAAVP